MQSGNGGAAASQRWIRGVNGGNLTIPSLSSKSVNCVECQQTCHYQWDSEIAYLWDRLAPTEWWMLGGAET